MAKTATTPTSHVSLRIGLFTIGVSLLSRAAPATGFASDRWVRRWAVTVSWLLTRSGGDRAPMSPVGSDVQRVPQAVADEVEGKRGDHEEEAREQHQPPGGVVEPLGIVQESAP